MLVFIYIGRRDVQEVLHGGTSFNVRSFKACFLLRVIDCPYQRQRLLGNPVLTRFALDSIYSVYLFVDQLLIYAWVWWTGACTWLVA